MVSGVFLSCVPPYFGVQGFTLNLELTNLANAAGQQAQELYVSILSVLGLEMYAAFV